jgi:hypothetical protein
MSSEQINLDNLETPKIIGQNPEIKVDINFLLTRVRQEKKRERKENFIFFWIVVSIILSVGIFFSL